MQSTQTQPLPPTSDEFFDGEKQQTRRELITCEKCSYYVFPERREIECVNCGRGHKFRTQDAIETPDGIVFKIKGKTCDPIPVMVN